MNRTINIQGSPKSTASSRHDTGSRRSTMRVLGYGDKQLVHRRMQGRELVGKMSFGTIPQTWRDHRPVRMQSHDPFQRYSGEYEIELVNYSIVFIDYSYFKLPLYVPIDK